MKQSSAIFAALLIGFVVYITTRGQLPAYVALFWTKTAAQTTPISLPGTNAPLTPGSTPLDPGGETVPNFGPLY